MKRKSVAILIPTLNEEKTLKSLLDSINKNIYRNKEIIIIDGGSTDSTVQIAKKAGATVLMEAGERKDRCPANAWNQGARHSDADILCFLDADCAGVNKKFLENGAGAFDVNTSAVYAGYRTTRDTWIERVLTKEKGVSMEPTFIRREVFLEIGGFPLIGYSEDWLFMKNAKGYARAHGMKEKTVESSYYIGHGVHTIKELFEQKVWYGRTSLLFLKRLKELKSLNENVMLHAVRVYSIPIYFLLFLTVFLLPFSSFFVMTAVLFLIIFMFLAMRDIKNRGIEKAFLGIFSGYAMLFGMIVSVLDRKARKGR